MSSVYVLEPPTKGKVVVNTTMGPLDIELWPKEAPKAVRNFVQLCLEGCYDRTIFHRVVKSFIVQGGDPTGTGSGGESIYGSTFADEFHSRLRFNHRGLVACANAGSPHSNGSQFFITFDRCDWLDRKNTIFGKVTGDSIYNLLRLGDVETDKDDRPLYPPPKILSVETSAEQEKKKDIHVSVRETLSSKKGDLKNDAETNYPDTYDHSDDDEAKFDEQMRLQILRKRRELGDISTREKLSTEKSTRKDREVSPLRNNADDTEGQITKVEKLSIKKKGIGSEARAERMAKADVDLQLLGHAEQERQMQKQKKRRLQGREEDTLAKLERFKMAVSAKLSGPSSSDSRGNDKEDESGWMTTKLKFIPEPSEKDNMARKDDPNEYVVVDPLLEKGKEKFNRMQAKLKRREREWAGKSIT